MDNKHDNGLVNEAIKQGAIPDGYDPVNIDFFKFEKPGDSITGQLLTKTITRINGSQVGKYTVKVITDGKAHDVSFLGSVLLDEKLSRIAIGSNIFISYTGDEAAGGNTMKRFNVATKRSS
jgi:hypothetical protein